MSLSRTKARKIAMIILYQILLHQKNKIKYDVNDIISSNVDESDDYIENMIRYIVDNQDELVELSNKYLESWSFNRLGVADQAIILIGIYELMKTDTPYLVCINEAIELSKLYSDENVSKIINAVLDNIYHKELKR